jgi:hypothetical protein
MAEALPDAEEHRNGTLVLALLSLIVGGVSGLVCATFRLARLCCMDAEYEGARTQFLQPNLLFRRYGHNSGVRAPTSGSSFPKWGIADRPATMACLCNNVPEV